MEKSTSRSHRTNKSHIRQSPGALSLAWLPVGIILCLGFSHFTVDDTFITLRYASNLALGEGPVFNPGERVEGCSSPLWMLILSLCAPLANALPKISGDLFPFAKVLGGLAYLTGVWAMRPLALRLGVPPGAAQLAYLGTLPLAFWGVSGMETPLFVLLTILIVTQTLSDRPMGYGLALLCLLALLTRPEAPLLVGFALGCLGWRRHLRVGPLALLFLVAALLLWARWAYYGDFLPNTYYAKSFQTPHRWRITLVNYVGSFMLRVIPMLSLPALAWLLLARRWKSFAVLGFAMLPFLFSILVGGDWMPAWRFLTPALPLLIVCAMRGIILLSHLPNGGSGPPAGASKGMAVTFRRRILFCWLLALLHTVTVGIGWERVLGPTPWNQYWLVQTPTLTSMRAMNAYNPHYVSVVKWLDENVHDSTTLAVGEAGFICYYSRLVCRDLHGLMDTTIARSSEFPNTVIGKKLPLHEEGFTSTRLGQYLMDQRPDLFLLSDGETWGPRDIIMDGNYRRMKRIGNFSLYMPAMHTPFMK